MTTDPQTIAMMRGEYAALAERTAVLEEACRELADVVSTLFGMAADGGDLTALGRSRLGDACDKASRLLGLGV